MIFDEICIYNYIYIQIYIYKYIYICVLTIHPASHGVAAHTAGLFRSVRGAKGGVEYEEQSSTVELTYITAGLVNIFTFPARGGSPS